MLPGIKSDTDKPRTSNALARLDLMLRTQKIDHLQDEHNE